MQRCSTANEDAPGSLPPDTLADIEALESLVWEALDAIAAINFQSRKKRFNLPLGLLQLRPPASAALSESPSNVSSSTFSGNDNSTKRFPSGVASDGLDACADRNWPLWRRADRLTWAVAASISDDYRSDDVDLIMILRCDSLAERLVLVLNFVRRIQSVWMSLGALSNSNHV